MTRGASAGRLRAGALGIGCVLCFVGALGALAEEPSGQPAGQPSEASAWYDEAMLYSLLYQAGQLSKATKAAQRAVKIAERVFGAGDERLAQSLNDLGVLYQEQGQPAEAAACHERALSIRKATQPIAPAAVVQSLNNLGKAYYAQQRSADAQPLFQESLSLIEQDAEAGPNHPYAVTPLHYLALIASADQEGDRANTLFLRAIAVLESQRMKNGPMLIVVLRDYADFLRATGHVEEADAVEARLADPSATSTPAPTP